MSGPTLEDVLSTGRGTERAFCCSQHGDDYASASVNVVKGVWVCYGCGAKGTVGDHAPSVEELQAVLLGTKAPRVLPESWLDVFDADHASPYWVSRYGIKVASANRCGTDPSTGAPTYPLRDAEGRLLGVVSRHSEEKPKYRYPWNTSTSQTLYGVLRASQVVVLVEGASDVMALQAAGVPRGWTVLGCYGAGLRHPQVGLVASLGPKVVALAFDADESGRRATELGHVQLEGGWDTVSVDWASVGAKDAGEVPRSRRMDVVKDVLVAAGCGKYVRSAA